jgi:LuxR family maltose regulon positive regulatory protein
MRELLRRLATQDTGTGDRSSVMRVSDAYVRDLLEAFQRDRPSRETGSALASVRAEAPIDPLTDRELEVLRLLAEGLSNKTIAGKLFVAPSTVKQHLKHVYDKLDVHSRTQAVARGQEIGLL